MERIDLVDLRIFVTAVLIQREVGGNLAELLDTVSYTMTQRERLRHEILALTAEGRLSAWILGVFPVAIGSVYQFFPDKRAIVLPAKRLADLGFTLVATAGFVAFVLMVFWSKLELRVLHAYLIPVGLGVLVFATAAPLTFTNAQYISDEIMTALAKAPIPVKLLVIEASGMIDIDYTGSQILTQRKTGNLMKSPFAFSKHGQSGIPGSELFPHVAGCVDDLCLIHSLHGTNPAHGGALLKLHTGSDNFVRPSMGAWVAYGLGSENRDLPAR